MPQSTHPASTVSSHQCCQYVVANLTVCTGRLVTKLGLCIWLTAVVLMTKGGPVSGIHRRRWILMLLDQPLLGVKVATWTTHQHCHVTWGEIQCCRYREITTMPIVAIVLLQGLALLSLGLRLLSGACGPLQG